MNIFRNNIAAFAAILALGSTTTGCMNANAGVVDHAMHGRMGSHGMAVIGKNHLLLHHMPLYRPPHDRQILTPATFADKEIRTAFEKWRQSYDGLISILPENFDLDRLDPDSSNAIGSFAADIYEGHFERGGQIKFKSVKFQLGKPIYHRPVIEDAASPPLYTYLENGNETYLVADIGPRPGVDEILLSTSSANLKSGERVRILSKEASAARILVMKKDQSILDIDILETLYRETADFELQL